MLAPELRDAIAGLAGEDAAELVEQARADARARVRAILADAMAEAMLDAARDAIAPPPPPAEAGDGWYVYGVVRAGAVAPPEGARAVIEGDLAAIVREVPLSEYGEAALRRNLEDIAWLEEAARHHETVLDELLGATTVIPLRLCTIYRSEDAVREMLAAEHAALVEALERLAGRTEWGVKAFRAPADESAADTDASGGAYMERRRREAEARRRADADVEAAFQRLAALSEEALANPLQRRELTGRDEEMILNGVFLVEDANEPAFRAVVEELGFELTGPWPPYNFVKRSIEAAR
jgi:hypothetical protein